MARIQFLALLAAASAAAIHAKKPNLVLMVLDDVGWADVGYHGSNFSTPNIDRLAYEGVRLDRYYVQQVCSPTRSALISARYPFRTGMQHCTTLMPGSSAALPFETPTIAEVLQATGYSTAAIGKWHLGYASWENTPTGRGFDSYAGYLQGQSDYYDKTIGMNIKGLNLVGLDVWRNRTCAREEIGKYSMDFYMREAQRILDVRDPAKPFFIYFAHQQIHIPLEAPPEKEHAEACSKVQVSLPDGKNRNTLCQMMSRLDTAIGEFVEMLKSRGLWEDTLLWVTSDNGGMAQYMDTWPASASSNYPLRGGKTTLFEGGVRAISFVTGGLLPPQAAGKRYGGLLQHVDIPATMIALAEAESPELDGFNVWDAIANNGPSPRSEVPVNVDVSGLAALCSHLPVQSQVAEVPEPEAGLEANYSALIQGDWKLINGFSGPYDGYWSNDPYLHTNATAGSAEVGGEKVWLFNVATDPEERHNVAADNVQVVLQMQARLKELSDPATGYRRPQLNIPDPRAFPYFNNGTWAPWRTQPAEIDQLVV